MKRLILLAARLYPRHWRHRYGREFEALLEDTKVAGPRELFDVLKGATTMRLIQSQWQLIGTFTLAGALFMAVVWASIPNTYRSEGTFAIPQTISLASVNEAAADALDSRQLQQLMRKYGFDSPDSVELSKKRIGIFKTAPSPAHASEQVVGVHFDDKDPVKAQAIAKEIMGSLTQRLNAKGITSTVVEAPPQPASPIAPALKKLLEMGLAGGLLCGTLAAFIRKRTTLATPSAS